MPRVPVTILAGFLGSGKTTRLNALLRQPLGHRIAVVLNEIGETGIDGAKLAAAQEFVELDGGCICCALNADLESTLERLGHRGGFDRLLIETTGIADPLPVAWTFERGGLHGLYRVDAVVVVADALNLPRTLAIAPEVALQLERADVILASKLDLVPTGLAGLAATVRPYNATAPILPAPADATPWDLLLDALPAGRPQAPATHHGHPPEAPWETWQLRTTHPLSEAALDRFCRSLPAGVYRAKGLVRTDEPAWLEVNAVGGRYEIEPVTPGTPPAESVLVCIGRPLDRGLLDRLACTLEA